MAEKMTWALNLQVAGGPKLAVTQLLEVEAYDKVVVEVNAGDTDKEVNVLPGGAGLAQFICITLTDPKKYSDQLTYKVNSAASPTVIALDAPHLFLGKGAVKLLDAAPSKLFFSSTLTEDVTVQILVGRDATP
ncbi:MAG: hypothetical protein NT169_05990 [Chloroflexi bacterium]|nr:hypothetical protein [Chloroflexota bacterium]